MSCTLLISTYNWPPALNVCLQSVLKQNVLPGEIVICDDGSKIETRTLINEFKKTCPIPVKHVWQEDDGFRAAQIRNKGFAIAECDYIIEIDGDLILHESFIKDHLRFKREASFVTGSRVLISPELTQKILSDKMLDNSWSSKNMVNVFNRMHIPFLQNLFASWYKQKGRHKYHARGCNMAFWKKDLISVNGYNEDFVGWGKEDSELAIRLMNNNVKKRFIKFGAICYHLHHSKVSREREETNDVLMLKTANDKITWAKNGLDKYL